jgi:hypothetical protein
MSKAAELAALIGSGQAQGDKNILINGAMTVSQRATSVSSYSSDAFCTVDRFKVRVGSLGVYTVSQATDAPSGFKYSLKLDCTTADASPASSDFLFLLQAIEGQDLQQLKKGTANAESLTLSFWVKSNKTGTGQVNLRDNDNDRLVGKTYTISSANTWEYKTVTFPPDTTGAITSDNTAGISLEIWLDSGSDYEGGAVPTSWEARSQTDRNAGGNLNIGSSTANEFLITGIQLEVGDVATPFEHRSFGDELARCQRYFTRIPRIDGSSANTEIANGMGNATNNFLGVISFPTEMRANPTLTASGSFRVFNGGTLNPTAGPSRSSSSTVCMGISVATGGGISTLNGLLLTLNNDSDANLQFSAEL